MPSWDTIADLLGLLGSILLVVPALRINRIAKTLSRVEAAQFSKADDVLLHELRASVEEDFRKRISLWSFGDEICLYVGLALLPASFLLKVVT